MSAESTFHPEQEEDRIAALRIVWVSIGWSLLGAAGVFFAGVIVVVSAGALRPDLAGPAGRRTVGAELSGIEQTPIWDARDGLDLRSRQEGVLERWAWIDRDAGTARIPIDRAIDLVLSEPAP